MKSRLVSIIIPTFDRPIMLKRTINSVLNQTYKNIEVIVVDDNNPDTPSRKETTKLMTEFEDKRIVYIKHNKNKNGSAARNTGFKVSNGDYIMFLDDDDEFFDRKVQEQLNRMESLDIEWGACYTSYERRLKSKMIAQSAETREGNLLLEELSRNLFVHAGSNLMIRREVVKELNGFDEHFKRNQDVEFLVRFFNRYKLAYVDYLGLIVNKDDRRNSKIDFSKLTTQYIEKFQSNIESLSEIQLFKFSTLINLQLIRYYFSKLRLIKFLLIIIKKKLSFFTVLDYFIYLIRRKFTKKVFGYNAND